MKPTRFKSELATEHGSQPNLYVNYSIGSWDKNYNSKS